MKNIAPGPDTRIDPCRTAVIYSDIGQEVLDAMPVCLQEEDPLALPEPGYSCTAQLGNGEVVGLFFGVVTRRLAFFPAPEILSGNRSTVEAIISESTLPENKVWFRWDRD